MTITNIAILIGLLMWGLIGWGYCAYQRVKMADLQERLEQVGEWAAKQLMSRYDN